MRQAHGTLHNKLRISSILVALAATVILGGCAPKLIGDYDDTIDKGITDLQQKAELYFSKLQSTPDTPYDSGFYDDINSRLAVLKSRAAALPKDDIIAQQVTNLKAQFASFQKIDKATTRPFPAVVVTDADSGITVSVESILKLEIAMKRGVAAPSKQ